MHLRCIDLGLLDYAQALTWQEELVQQRCQGEAEDTLLLLEHPPVFTLGRGGDERHLLNPRQIPVYRAGRGGDVTFHGPGQLVGYPIIDLGQHRRDVHVYLRRLETVLITTLQQLGMAAHRKNGFTGVWVNEEKIASIGVGVRRWVTFHGFALNVNTDLSYFADIVPCGLTGIQMTSIAELVRQPIDLGTVKAIVAKAFTHYFGYTEMVWQSSFLTQVSSLKSQVSSL